jgi:hypothetical protein
MGDKVKLRHRLDRLEALANAATKPRVLHVDGRRYSAAYGDPAAERALIEDEARLQGVDPSEVVFVAPRPCRDAEEWVAEFRPIQDES